MAPPSSTAPMRFLERLAPGARAAIVRAALPSRFAPRAAPEPLAEQAFNPQVEGRTAASSAELPPAPRAEHVAPSVGVSAAPVTLHFRRAPATSSDSEPVRSPARAVSEIPTALTPTTIARVASMASPPQSLRGARERTSTARPEVTLHASGPIAAREPLPAPADVRPPLRESALAGRAARHSEAPDVVHVTIDRIDVRMPAAARPAQRRDSKPRATSTVALGDYLRRRDGPRSEGGP
jgi:hypothetical protein